MPDVMVQSIAPHHSLENMDEHEPMPHAVHAADFLGKNLGSATEVELLSSTSSDLIDLGACLSSPVEATFRRRHGLIDAVASGAM